MRLRLASLGLACGSRICFNYPRGIKLTKRISHLVSRFVVHALDCYYDGAVQRQIGPVRRAWFTGSSVRACLFLTGAVLVTFGADKDGSSIKVKLLDKALNSHLSLAASVKGST